MRNYTAIIAEDDYDVLKTLPSFSTALYFFLIKTLSNCDKNYLPITYTNFELSIIFKKRPETISRYINLLHKKNLIKINYYPTKNGIKRIIQKKIYE